MRDPTQLREEARLHLRAYASASDQKMRERHAERAFELAQIAEAIERAGIDKMDKAS